MRALRPSGAWKADLPNVVTLRQEVQADACHPQEAGGVLDPSPPSGGAGGAWTLSQRGDRRPHRRLTTVVTKYDRNWGPWTLSSLDINI